MKVQIKKAHMLCLLWSKSNIFMQQFHVVFGSIWKFVAKQPLTHFDEAKNWVWRLGWWYAVCSFQWPLNLNFEYHPPACAFTFEEHWQRGTRIQKDFALQAALMTSIASCQILQPPFFK